MGTLTSAQATFFPWPFVLRMEGGTAGGNGKRKYERGRERYQPLSVPARTLAHVLGCHVWPAEAGPLAPRHNPTQPPGVGGFTQYP